MSDLDSASNDAGFTAEEQAAFDAYASGADAPAPAAQEPAGGSEPAGAAPVAPNAAEPAAAPAAAPAGEPAAAPGEVVDPDADDVDDAEANRGRFVRHGAFHKERERRKAVERQFSELQERFARGDERLRLLTEAMQKPAGATGAAAPAAAAPAEPETPPNPDEDIFGYVKHLEKQLTDLRNGHQQTAEAQTKAAEEQRVANERNAIVSYYQQDIRQAMTTDPSVGEAYSYLFQGRVSELMHFGMNQEQAVETAQGEELDMVKAAIQRKVSPAAMIVHLAKGRGYAQKAPQPAAPAAPAAPVETAAQKAERLSAGQAASKSLSAAGGAPAGEVTLEQLASMSEADFEKFSRNNPKKLAALMGAV